MALVDGSLNAALPPHGNVKTWFAPEPGVELRPLLAKNLDTAEQDFINTYGLTPTEAAAFRGRIEREGTASILAAVRI